MLLIPKRLSAKIKGRAYKRLSLLALLANIRLGQKWLTPRTLCYPLLGAKIKAEACQLFRQDLLTISEKD
jgi:hypothetical protein